MASGINFAMAHLERAHSSFEYQLMTASWRDYVGDIVVMREVVFRSLKCCLHLQDSSKVQV